MLDVLIIGAGPAGVQVSYFLKKHGIKHKIIEKASMPGAFFALYPRHRKLISINKRYTGSDSPEFNLRHDWNSLLSDNGLKFTAYDEELFPSAESFLDYLADFVEEENIDISFDCEVRTIRKDVNGFNIELNNGETCSAKNIVVATGFNKTNRPSIPGIEYAIDYSEMSTNRNDFANKRVLIIGKGNSAFETADHLAGTAALIHLVSPNPIRLAWQTHYVGNLRAVNNNILDMYQLKSQHAILDGTVKEITKHNGSYIVDVVYAHAEGEVESLYYDEILCCAGFKMDDEIFSESSRPETTMNGKYPRLTSTYESVNISGLYFAGTLTHANDYRKGTSGFIHGFRYNASALAHILNYRINQTPIPYNQLTTDVTELSRYLINRFNVVSSIWQQPAILAEVYKIGSGNVEHYEALPVNYAVEDYFNHDEILLVTFEYGEHTDGDIFKQQRIARDNYDNAKNSKFLHPVLRHYNNGKLVNEFHVIEDLEAFWTIDEHLDHIATFIAKIVDEVVYE